MNVSRQEGTRMAPSHPSEPILAFAYYRCSTDQQDLSIAQQREAVQAYAARRGYRILREFMDEGISGLATEKRVAFQQVIQAALAPTPAARVVLCYDISRFGRFTSDEAGHYEFILRQNGVRVIYVAEPLTHDDSLGDELIKGLKRAMSHEYSRQLSQVVTRGLRNRAARGLWTGGWPPYGYQRAILAPDGSIRALDRGQRAARGERITLIVNPVEVKIVHWIFTAFTRGLGLTAIRDALSTQGVPPPNHRQRGGTAAWAKHTVWGLVRNPIYVGRRIYWKARYRTLGRRKGKQPRPSDDWIIQEGFPQIIPQAIFDAAQKRRRSYRFAAGRPYHRPYLLTGLIRCGNCGKHWQGHRTVSGQGYVTHTYWCGGYVMSGKHVCSTTSVPAAYLEGYVLDGIRKRVQQLSREDRLRAKLQERLTCSPGPRVSIDTLIHGLTDTKERLARLFQAVEAGGGEIRPLVARIKTLDDQRQQLEQKIERARREDTQALGGLREDSITEMLGWLDRIEDVLAEGNAEERKLMVRSFLAGIVVEKAKGRIKASWYALPTPPGEGGLSVKLVAVAGLEPATKGL
ncbi:MAG: recombinase family protein [Candidatus Methylomirabilales bacterium]